MSSIKIEVVPLEKERMAEITEFFKIMLTLPEDLQRHVFCASQRMLVRDLDKMDLKMALEEVVGWYQPELVQSRPESTS